MPFQVYTVKCHWKQQFVNVKQNTKPKPKLPSDNFIQSLIYDRTITIAMVICVYNSLCRFKANQWNKKK